MIYIILPERYAHALDEDFEEQKKQEEIDLQNGYVKYKSEYILFFYPPYYILPEDKMYIKGIYTSIMYDQLRLIKRIVINDPSPAEIFYPKSAQKEDPRLDFLAGITTPPPDRFPARAILMNKFQNNIPNPENLLSNQESLKLLRPEDIHILSTVEKTGALFKIHIYLVRNGSIFYESEMTSAEIDISKNILDFSRNVAIHMNRAETGTFEISANLTRASVYINDQFAGYAPQIVSNAIAGTNRVVVRKDGYKIWEKTLELKRGEKINLNAILEPYSFLSRIKVTTTPENCDVYLGVEYKGKSPIIIENIPPGYQRIRVIKEGFIDFYQTITVTEDSQEPEYNVIASLSPGKSELYYEIDKPILFGLSNEKLFQTSALLTMATGLSGLFFEIEKQAAQNTIFTYENSGRSLTASQLYQIDALKNDASLYTSLETGLFVGAGIFLTSTIIFFIRYVDSQDLPIANLYPNLSSGNRVSLKLDLDFNTVKLAFQSRY